jgi:hypothetical protein
LLLLLTAAPGPQQTHAHPSGFGGCRPCSAFVQAAGLDNLAEAASSLLLDAVSPNAGALFAIRVRPSAAHVYVLSHTCLVVGVYCTQVEDATAADLAATPGGSASVDRAWKAATKIRGIEPRPPPTGTPPPVSSTAHWRGGINCSAAENDPQTGTAKTVTNSDSHFHKSLQGMDTVDPAERLKRWTRDEAAASGARGALSGDCH